MRRILATAILVLSTLLPTHSVAGNTWGTDFSDLWWEPAESGWGTNIAHQGDTIFMTLFVYGADRMPRWYVASAMTSQGGADSATFVGALSETTGPYLGGAFNPLEVSIRTVGIATIRFSSAKVGSLTYSVDGVSVSKTLERQTFRANNMTGSYYGAEVGTLAGCSTSVGAFENKATLSVSQGGNTVSIVSTLNDSLSCTYAGNYTQAGRMGQIVGSMSCTNGSTGAFYAHEVEASYLGFLASYSVNYGNGCLETGRMGGVKR